MDRVSICHETASQQHAAYVQALRDLGVHIIELPALHDHPDAVFVEDITVVLDEIAVLTRPGAASRQGEVDSIADTLAPQRTLARIEAPGTLEGGDVMPIDRTIYVGASTRSNSDGIKQFATILEPHGYQVQAVDVPGALHLKTAATYLGDSTVLANPAWLDMSAFKDMNIIEVHPDEPFAGNGIRIDDTVIFHEQFERTAERLESAGFQLRLVPSTELAKAEGSLTCKSVIFRKH